MEDSSHHRIWRGREALDGQLAPNGHTAGDNRGTGKIEGKLCVRLLVCGVAVPIIHEDVVKLIRRLPKRQPWDRVRCEKHARKERVLFRQKA